MRLLLCLTLSLAACKGESKKPAPAAVEETSAVNTKAEPATDSAADWKAIEALAETKPAEGPSTQLVRALKLAKEDGEDWRASLSDNSTALKDYLEGAEAIAALKKWAAAKGALPPIQSPIQLGVVTLDLFDLARITLATARSAKDIEVVEYLGAALYTTGHSLLEAQIGTKLVNDAASKRKELGLPAASLPKLDMVRVLASEALSVRARSEYDMTEAGRKELAAALRQMPAHEKGNADEISIDDLIPDEAHQKATQAFWVAALRGAQRGESTETTLARLESATKTAPNAVKNRVDVVPTTAKLVVASYEAANQPGAATAQARRK